MRRGTVALIGLAAVLFAAKGAQGHAFLDRADPPVGGTLRTPPARVQVWFTEGLEAAFSRIQVFNQAGQQVDRKDNELDPSNPAILRVSLPPLPPGVYRVIWRVLSVDTHVTEGDFVFQILP